jgi:hypothetical protein
VRSAYGDIKSAAAGRLPGEGDVGRIGAAVKQRLVGREGVVSRGRERVLGSEPVVDREDPGASPSADLRGQRRGLESVPKHVHAAVEVQHDMARLNAGDGDLGDRDAAQRAPGHGQVRGQRLRRNQLLQSPPLLVDVGVGREASLPQDRFEGLSLLSAHDCSLSVGLAETARTGGRGEGGSVLMPLDSPGSGCDQP